MFLPKDFSTINEKTQEFRHKVDEYILQKYREYVASISSYFFDKICCGLEKNEKNEIPISYGINFLRSETHRMEKFPSERSLFDYGCSFTIHLHKNNFYGIFYCESNDLRKMWLKQEWITEYGYWNNTDPLEGIDDEQWKQRGENWDEILKDFSYTPNMNGFIAELTRKMFYYVPREIDEIMPLIPDYTERLHRISYNDLFINFCKIDNEGKIIQDFFEFNKWILNGNLGFEKFEETKDKFSKKLKKEITKDMLLGKI